jgi:hypothetical protein
MPFHAGLRQRVVAQKEYVIELNILEVVVPLREGSHESLWNGRVATIIHPVTALDILHGFRRALQL